MKNPPMQKQRPPIRLLLALAAAALVAGCGLKGDPRLPTGQADAFPATYPKGAVPNLERPQNIFTKRYY
jgi:predicted small lipoprotein YifL